MTPVEYEEKNVSNFLISVLLGEVQVFGKRSRRYSTSYIHVVVKL